MRTGGALSPASWDEALQRAADGLGAAKGKVAAIVGGGASNEEGYLVQRIVRGPLASADVTSSSAPSLPAELRQRLNDPALAVSMADIDHAGTVLVLGTDPMHEMPILELRIRKAVRRNGAQLLVATERPTALDGGAAIGSDGCLEAHRYEPGAGADFLRDLHGAIARGDTDNGFAAALKRRRPGRDRLERADARWATPTPRRPCSTSPTCSASTAWMVAACSRSPARPTAAACARWAAPRPPARATRRPRQAARPPRSARPWRAASWRR